MAVYDIHALYNRIAEILSDGYDLAEISELEESDGLPACLTFSATDNSIEYVDYEEVESIDLSIHQTRNISSTDFCSDILFTYDEVSTLFCAINNSLEYFKELSKRSDTSRDDKDKIRKASVEMRNLQAKFAKSTKRLNSLARKNND